MVETVTGGLFETADAAQGTAALLSRVASLSSTHAGAGRNKLFIRGIADSSFVGPTQATVGQYWGNKNKKPTTTWVAGYIMETAGFEPASRGPDTNLSTCVVY